MSGRRAIERLAHTLTYASTRPTTPISSVSDDMHGGRHAVKSGSRPKPQDVAIAPFFVSQPDPARLGWIETTAVQRPKNGPAPVSEVGMGRLNPFEIKRNLALDRVPFMVGDREVAERREPGSNGLHADSRVYVKICAARLVLIPTATHEITTCSNDQLGVERLRVPIYDDLAYCRQLISRVG